MDAYARFRYTVKADVPEWRNGRRGGLKNRCRKTCEFKSRLGHQLRIKLPSGELFCCKGLLTNKFSLMSERTSMGR